MHVNDCKYGPDETFVDLHGHRIVSRPDPAAHLVRHQAAIAEAEKKPIPPHDDWLHELFPFTDAAHDGIRWIGTHLGKSLGKFPTLGLAIAEAKKRHPWPKSEPATKEE